MTCHAYSYTVTFAKWLDGYGTEHSCDAMWAVFVALVVGGALTWIWFEDVALDRHRARVRLAKARVV